MHWNSMSEFFAMGGYGLYVWGSFGFTVVVLAWEVLALRSRSKMARRALRVKGSL